MVRVDGLIIKIWRAHPSDMPRALLVLLVLFVLIFIFVVFLFNDA